MCAAEIESLMYTGMINGRPDVPWHSEGVFAGEKTIKSKEAIIMAGLDWEVEVKDLHTNCLNELGENSLLEVPSHKAIVRPFDNKILGVVGQKYTPIQNSEAFEFMDGLVETGDMEYHTAGSLRGGQVVWLLGDIGSFDVSRGEDEVKKYLLLATSHDGTQALRCLPTAVRVVCMNTTQAALSQGHNEGLTIRHIGDVQMKMDAAQRILAHAQDRFETFKQFAQFSASKSMTSKMAQEIIKRLIRDPKEELEKGQSRIAQEARATVLNLFENGRGQELNTARGTAWGMFNAVTEYLNYFKRTRGNNQEKRFADLLGSSNIPMISNVVSKINAA